MHIQSVGDYETTFQHDGSPVDFWTDFDVEYSTQPTATYKIMIFQNGDSVGEVVCDPFDVGTQLMEREAEVRGTVKESYLGLMHCETDLPEGELTLAVNFDVEGRMTVFRADLVLKIRED